MGRRKLRALQGLACFLVSWPHSPFRSCHLLAVPWLRNEPSLIPATPPRCPHPGTNGGWSPGPACFQLRAGLSHQAGTCCSNGPLGPILGNRTARRKDGGARVSIPSSPPGCPRPPGQLLRKSAPIPLVLGRWVGSPSSQVCWGCVAWQPIKVFPEQGKGRTRRSGPQPLAIGCPWSLEPLWGSQAQPRLPEPTPGNPEREERRTSGKTP